VIRQAGKPGRHRAGPNRSRCLDKLRRDLAIAALINTPEAALGQQES
jgi:hypothetical protein